VTLTAQTPTNGDGWAAAATSGDLAYRTQSLKYQPVELSLDESVNRLALLWLYVRAAFVSFLFWMVVFVLWLITSAHTFANTAGTGATPDFSLLFIGSLLAFLLFWFVMLFTKTQEPIAEWRSMIEERAAAATSAYAAIFGSLRRRQIPLNPAAMRVRSEILGQEAVNSRLVINERGYTAYVSVFPYGTSLYVGWMMFRNRRGYQLILTFLADAVGSIFGRSDLVSQMLRTEKVRAMREALHYAAREGVDTAIRGIEVQMATTFGFDVPIQDLEAAPQNAAVGYSAPAPDFGQLAPQHAHAAPVPAPEPFATSEPTPPVQN
jgi:hypothetical protein